MEPLGAVIGHGIRCDGAKAAVIGGRPLGDAGTALAFLHWTNASPVIEPIPASVRRMVTMLLV